MAALQAGALAGAGLDVFEVEPATHDNPLHSMPNVVTTPHHAGESDEMHAFGPEAAMNDVAHVLRGNPPRSVQNPAVLQPGRLARSRQCAERASGDWRSPMSVRLTGWGGIGEIGGNKLLLEDGDWQVLLDFGKSFGAHARYFEEFLTPRTTTGAFDFLRTGLLPPLEGLYRPDLELLPEVRAFWTHARNQAGYRNDVRPRAVLLSHAHQDHHGHLSFLDTGIPIVSSAVTALIVKGMQDCGQPGLENETVIVRPRIADGAVLKHRAGIGRPAVLASHRQRRLDPSSRGILDDAPFQQADGRLDPARHGAVRRSNRRSSRPRLSGRPLDPRRAWIRH